MGYDEIHRFSKNEHGTDASRRNAINGLRQRRRIGELPPAYPNGWFVILESDQLRIRSSKELNVLGKAHHKVFNIVGLKSQEVLFDILGLNLVAWRGNSGKSYVADAYCPHLGAHLGVGGKVSGECIKCPFHGWAFHGTDGKLMNIPYSDQGIMIMP